MKNIILETLNESIATKEKFIQNNIDHIANGANKIAASISSGNKLLICGNGGSAADAQHIAAEFVNRFQIERPPLAAIAITTNTSIITSIGNDYDFNDIFSKQISALGSEGDIACGISTSGNSQNVIKALVEAKKKGLYTIGMTGDGGGELAKIVDLLYSVPSNVTARIQETHIILGHILCDLVDRLLYPDNFA